MDYVFLSLNPQSFKLTHLSFCRNDELENPNSEEEELDDNDTILDIGEMPVAQIQ